MQFRMTWARINGWCKDSKEVNWKESQEEGEKRKL